MKKSLHGKGLNVQCASRSEKYTTYEGNVLVGSPN